jgi:hypothetical protein
MRGTSEYGDWYAGLADDAKDAIVAVLLRLQADGPALRRPISGQIKLSRHKSMMELVVPRGDIRVLYTFDPDRNAILLLGGSKTGAWNRWYRTAVPLADAIYSRYLASRSAEQPKPHEDQPKGGPTR